MEMTNNGALNRTYELYIGGNRIDERKYELIQAMAVHELAKKGDRVSFKLPTSSTSVDEEYYHTATDLVYLRSELVVQPCERCRINGMAKVLIRVYVDSEFSSC